MDLSNPVLRWSACGGSRVEVERTEGGAVWVVVMVVGEQVFGYELVPMIGMTYPKADVSD